MGVLLPVMLQLLPLNLVLTASDLPETTAETEVAVRVDEAIAAKIVPPSMIGNLLAVSRFPPA